MALRMVVDDLRPITFEEHFARQKRDCLVNVFPAGAGRVAYISVDITDRKRAEQALRKTLEDAGRLNQQLEAETARANAAATQAQAATVAKSMFLANMSHEFAPRSTASSGSTPCCWTCSRMPRRSTLRPFNYMRAARSGWRWAMR